MIEYEVVVTDKERKVRAILYGTASDAMKELARRVPRELITEDIKRKAIMPGYFFQEVVCHPEDEFDPEIGKRLAKERLLKRYYHRKKVLVRRVLLDMKKKYDQITWPE